MKTKTEKQLLQDILNELKIINEKNKYPPTIKEQLGIGEFPTTSGIITGCQHISDGRVYTSYPPRNRCLICGQFYR